MGSAKYAATASLAVLISAVFTAGSAYAATPALSFVSLGGNSVQISVSGDANATVLFYYSTGGASGIQLANLGSTNAAGSFSTTIDSASYNISPGSSVYVTVNGQQSGAQAWPSATGTPSLSQSNLTLGLGQSVTVFSQGNSSAVYVASNANPSVAAVQINGTQIAATGNQIGSTSASICYAGTASGCANLNVTVQSASALSFSQNNIALAVGQSISVAVSGGSGTYSITANSDSSAVSAVLTGANIAISAPAAGSASVTVCDSSGNCGTLSITAGASSGTSSVALVFDNASPQVAVGQVLTVNISGGSGYYITGNSSPGAASQSLNGSALAVSGLAAGSTTITVCSASSGCGAVNVTVIGSSASSQSVTFGVSNPALTVGQTMNISLSGGSSYYTSSNPSANVVQASVSGNTLSLSGMSAGSDSLTVCASGGGCNALYINVSTNAAVQNLPQASTQGSAQTSQTQASLLAAIQSVQGQLAQIISEIQTMENILSQLASGLASGGQFASAGPRSGGAGRYVFTQFLKLGLRGAEVTALQERLARDGFYSGAATGYYGPLTEEAVKAYQSAQGVNPAGYVGPSTRAALNAGK